MPINILIRPARASDAQQLATLYNPYIENSIVTFELEPIDQAEMQSRIEKVELDGLVWLVAEVENRIAGYAYAGKWRPRPAYRFAAESSIYLDPEFQGKGIGTLLYTDLVNELRPKGIKTLIGGVALPNEASVRLHESLGFKKVAHFEKVGFKLDQWVDVGYWQLPL